MAVLSRLCTELGLQEADDLVKSPRGHVAIQVSNPVGIGYQTMDTCVPFIPVGKPVSPSDAETLGIRAGILSDRHVAFFLLLILDSDGELGSPPFAGRELPQRLRFAEHLGMTERALRKWLERALAQTPGKILRWDHDGMGRQTSRTGGPWRLHVQSSIVVPDATAALDFIERQQLLGRTRRSEPCELLADAQRLQEQCRWDDSLAALEAAVDMFRRRRWRRDAPLWFDLLLTLGGTRMQLGDERLRPDVSFNILRSASRQRLGGNDADLIRARAHYLAALVCNHTRTLPAIEAALAHLDRASELLKGLPSQAAIREFWRTRSYRELIMAALTGTAQPKRSSAILQASRVIEERFDQKCMRYGESLLCANRPAEALEYVGAAVRSGRLYAPARIIGERLVAVAGWRAGAGSSATLEALEHVQQEAEALGFAHQVRQVRLQKRLVRRGVRAKVTR